MIRSSILGQGQPDDDPNFDFNAPVETAGTTDPVVSSSSSSSSADTTQIMKAILKAAPLLSDSDRAAIGSVAISVGTAVGTICSPGIGTAIGAAIGAAIAGVTHFIRFSTQHYTWDQANVRARSYATDVAKALQTNVSAEQFSYVASILPDLVKSFVVSSDWWDYSTRKTLLDDFDKNVAEYGTSDFGRIWIAMWEGAIWIFGNFDTARPETLTNEFMPTFLAPTLQSALVQSGSKYKTSWMDSNGNPVTPPVTVETSSNVAGFGTIAGIILAVVGVSIVGRRK